MVALNKTSSLWTKRMPVLARDSRKLSASPDEPGPLCCFLICNICCWVAHC
jgi:hypothetical protein